MLAFRSNLKFKLSALFFLFSAGLSIALATGSYFKTQDTLLTSLRDRLRNMAYLTALGLDSEAIHKLKAQLKPELNQAAIDRVHTSPEFKAISGRLSEIQQQEEDLILYAYLIVQSEDQQEGIVLAESATQSEFQAIRELIQESRQEGHSNITIDEQVVALQDRSDASILEEIADIQEVWHFGHRFELSYYPVMQQAYADRSNITEPELTYDPEGESFISTQPGQWLISGYAPVFDRKGNFQGLVGLDISADQLQASMAETFWFHFWSGSIAVLIALIASLLLGWFMTRDLRRLETSVHALSARQLNVRAPIDSQDEIGRLARAFNGMADTIQSYNEHLESMVARRTEDLKAANHSLHERNEQLRNDLNMARRVQENLLPDQNRFKEMPAVNLAFYYLPMEGVGGDLYDIFAIDEKHYGFLIADVSGHGVASALITAMAKVAFHTHAINNLSPAMVCKLVNMDLYRLIGDLLHYLTAAYAVLNIETGELSFSLAGHQPLLLHRVQEDTIEELWSQSIFIGVEPEIDSQQKTTFMQQGDRLFLYTDGILETRDPAGKIYDMHRLKKAIQENAELMPEQLVDAIIKDVENHSQDFATEDDRALVCVEFKSPHQIRTGIEEIHRTNLFT